MLATIPAELCGGQALIHRRGRAPTPALLRRARRSGRGTIDDSLAEGTETVILALRPDPATASPRGGRARRCRSWMPTNRQRGAEDRLDPPPARHEQRNKMQQNFLSSVPASRYDREN